MRGPYPLPGEILMKRAGQDTFWSRPRLDGSRVMFEFDDRGQRIPSAVSRGALEELTGRRHLKAADLLRCFAEARDRIEALCVPFRIGHLSLISFDYGV